MTKQSALDVYYVLCPISILCSLYVIISVIQFGYSTSPSKLVLCLHLTVLVENIASLPDAFITNDGLCAFIGFLRTYFGFANAIVVFMIVFHYRYIFIIDKYKLKDFVSRHREKIIFIFPIMTILPFFTGSYGQENSIWCSIQTNSITGTTWSFAVYYGWIIGIIGISTTLMCRTILEVYIADSAIASLLLKSIGVYAVISILSWFPRCLAAFHILSYINSNIFLYFSSIAYFVVFLFEKKSLQSFEENAIKNAFITTNSEHDSAYISWQFDSTFLRSSSSSHSKGSTPRNSWTIHNKNKTKKRKIRQNIFSTSLSRLSTVLLSAHNNSNSNNNTAASEKSRHLIGSQSFVISPLYGEDGSHIHRVPSSDNRPLSANAINPINTTQSTVLANNAPSSPHPTPSLDSVSPPPPATSPTVTLPPSLTPITHHSASSRPHSIEGGISARLLRPKSQLINYENILKYNMNVDEDAAKRSHHSMKFLSSPFSSERKKVLPKDNEGSSTNTSNNNSHSVKLSSSNIAGGDEGSGISEKRPFSSKRPPSGKRNDSSLPTNGHALALQNPVNSTALEGVLEENQEKLHLSAERSDNTNYV
jgi:hypothetical protein